LKIASPDAGIEPARIGPNAIIQTLEALRELRGGGATDDLLLAAGLERYAAESPTAMVPEGDVSLLYRMLRTRLGEPEANATMRLAGAKTAAYLLANRIPRPAQVVLRRLPARFAAPLLLSSITKHTWTFAGSGVVSIASGPPLRIAIRSCPICRGAVGDRPHCSYYAASFEGLFRVLVDARSSVVEVACEGSGAPSCVFEFRW
jgi:divinyl protochlorophyllide a 8-vinyl-reductase